MNSKDSRYGIFTQNDLIKELTKGQEQRTVLFGQIVKIEGKLAGGNVSVKFLKEGETWESAIFSCNQSSIVNIPDALWPFIASITSPQERVKISKNKELLEKFRTVSKDVVVGFTDNTNDVHLGKVRYIGVVKGMGHCYGIELHERRKNNNCNGNCAGIQYFYCLPGFGIFTTIDRVIPNTYSRTTNNRQPEVTPDIDICLQKNISSIYDDKPKYEVIATKYGEYPKKFLPSKPSSYIRNSLSLQNIVCADAPAENPNNDFDGNSIIQPDKTHLINDVKLRNKSEMDLIDVIGNSWNGTTDSKELESFSNLSKTLDKNDNINEKYVTHEIKSSRNKSMNPLSHLLDGGTARSKSKFYTDENFEEPKAKPKKVEKKINERNEQALRSSTFYVNNDNPKYRDPVPGTTNELALGSLVEVQNDVTEEPLYGVVRWLGADNATNFVLVGVELEDEQSHLPLTLTDGTHAGERYFKCAEGRALFVPLEQCHKDSRFQDGTPTPVHQASAQNFMDCPVIPGAMAPLCMPSEEDVEAVCGKRRGIQGHHNSCYLDVTLFAMFTFTSVFDSLLFRPKNPYDIDDYEEVQRVLKEEIVNPLRKNLYVSADHVMKLRRLLDKLGSVSGMTCEEKDPEEFLNSLLAQILKAEPFLKLNSGQESFYYQLFVEKQNLTLPTVQQLFEQSFLASDIKLKEVPSCLIIQMPRFGKDYKMYPRILPSQLLDVTDVIEKSPRQCIVCGKLAKAECRECFDEHSNAGLESTAFCTNCLITAHRHERRLHHKPKKLEVDHDFSIMEDHCRPPRLFMELFAVICIETSHYVAFVKCGVGHEAPWCFFDSMADRKGEKNGFNIPEMVACRDVSRWLSDEHICRQLHEDFPVDRHLPEHARRLLCDAYICMYQSSDVMMYR